MSTVTEVRVFRGVARLSFDDAAPLKVRLKHFKALPLEAGDEVDAEEYAARWPRRSAPTPTRRP